MIKQTTLMRERSYQRWGRAVVWTAPLWLALVSGTGPALAEDGTEQRINRLEDEVRELRMEMRSGTADKGEARDRSVLFHGYGELHYNHPVVDGTGFPSGDLRPTLDFHRMVLGWSVALNDRLSVHAEVDFEHAAQEIELEFAYLEYQWSDAVRFRAGSLLMPVGPLNEHHEPPLFYSVERPYVQKYIIPTTWQEGGAGLAGQTTAGVKYRLYVVEGLDARQFGGNGIKDGRQTLNEDTNKAFNFGGVGRLEYAGLPGLAVGASLYSAAAAQGDTDIDHAQVTLWDADVRWRLKGADLTGLYARTQVGGADRISAAVGETVGSEQMGWYVEGAYHLGHLIESDWDVVPFVRWEELDTQAKIPVGLPRDPTTDRRVVTTGFAYYPHPDVAIKADVERWKDGTDDTVSRWNLGLGYQF